MAKSEMDVPGLYRIIPLMELRRTKGVSFDILVQDDIPAIHAVDRVIHEGGAISPGSVGSVARPWYMHPHQADNLMVLHGTRFVEIYTKAHGRVESFTVRPDLVMHGRRVVFDGPAMLVWPRKVFHRIKSCDTEGSKSINLATHYRGFDIRTNFNIYDLDVETGEYRVIREGHKDQR